MNKRWTLIALATFVLTISSAMVAQAQNNRTWVSGVGASANTATGCQQAAPCRFFSDAIPITNTGGEVVAVDSAGYGGIVANKAITITGAPGAFAYIVVVASSAGVIVNPGANALVVLRHLHVQGMNAANSTGLQQGSGRVVIEDSSFEQLTTGVLVQAGALTMERVSITQNSLGVQAQGQGPDLDSNPTCTPTTTVVRISNGLIAFNTTAFEMDNPGSNNNVSTGALCSNTGFNTGPNCGGTRSQGSNNSMNIFLRDASGQGNGQPNIMGNGTFVVATGNFEQNPNPIPAGQQYSPSIGSYSSQQQNSFAACGNPAQ